MIRLKILLTGLCLLSGLFLWSQVSEIEYFFDTDPGIGLGTKVTGFTASSSVLADATIATTSLSKGFHVLYFRTKSTLTETKWASSSVVTESVARWGLPEGRLIYLDNSTATNPTVDAYEYFFDGDPGYGAGTLVTGSPIVFPNEPSIATTSLSQGFHVLYVRARLTGGTWGIPEGRLVYIDQVGTVSAVASLEYFLDTDPGYGGGTAVTGFTAGANITSNFTIATTSVSTGFHKLYIRARLSSGGWGIPEERLVYVDNVGTLSPVSALEYFFDTDPGYGNGTAISGITASLDVVANQAIATTSLSLGFHNLYIRARTSSGGWGIPESRLIYIDQSGVVSTVSSLEYFFDSDPGYGLATQIAIQAGDSALANVFLAAAQLSEGQHHLFVRPKDANGKWGIPESVSFFQFSPSRQLDSVSLLAFYKETDGPNWQTRTNWNNGSIKNWFGVTVTNNRVSALALPGNKLDGAIPKPLGYMTELLQVDLSRNILKDTVPASLKDLAKLQSLSLHANKLDEMQDLSGISALTTLHLDSNFFDFLDLEPLISIPTFTYSNQKPFNDAASNTLIKIGDPYTFQRTIKGANNQYQWTKGGANVPFGDYEDLAITSFTSADTGTYHLVVTNPNLPALTIKSYPARLYISQRAEDSLAMVSLYNSLGGANWTNKQNWLTGQLQTWGGLTVSSGRVTAVNLTQNNLSGKVPANLSYADQLTSINLSGNNVTDTIPASLVKITAMQTLNLSSNKISSIPSFSAAPSLTGLNVATNRLQFGDLEKNVGIQNFQYSPQDSITIRMDTVVDTGTNFSLALSPTGANNSYQWFFKGNPISGATAKTLSIQNIQLTHEGQYKLRITNSQLPNLTLYSGTVDVLMSSLKRDSEALMALYNQTGGTNWSPAVNWTSTTDVTQWNSVTFDQTNTRVIGVNLASHNLKGSVPTQLRNITSLQSADFSNNDLNSIPKLSLMPNLTSLNVSNNRLGFGEIIANQGIQTFTYSPQKTLTPGETTKIPVGTSYTVQPTVSGNGNQYQWAFRNLFGTTQDKNLPGKTSRSFTIKSIEYDSMGAYYLKITNPSVQNLTLTTGDYNVFATADLMGSLFTPAGAALTEASVLLYRARVGRYDSIARVRPDSNGKYLFEDIVLGTHLAKAVPDNDLNFSTYYGNTIIWTDADSIVLKENDGTNYNIKIAGTFDIGEEEFVTGLVELDDEGEEGRILARRKVVRAGCSMKRYKGTGRGSQDEFDLEFYVETDDEGKFSFADLPNGLYRLNIDYPGVKMDENSFVDIEITGEMVLELLAVITDEGIVVEQTNALGIHRPYVGEFSIYPNPAEIQAIVSYQLKRPVESATLKVWALDGTLIQSRAAPGNVGLNEVSLDVSTMTKGVYITTITSINYEFVIQQRLIVGDQSNN